MFGERAMIYSYDIIENCWTLNWQMYPQLQPGPTYGQPTQARARLKIILIGPKFCQKLHTTVVHNLQLVLNIYHENEVLIITFGCFKGGPTTRNIT